VFEVPAEEIGDARVVLTIVGGEIVHEPPGGGGTRGPLVPRGLSLW
jgi:hypothetical protein